jgi:hypothetical protein
MEDWFQNKNQPKLPPLEHLPSAAFSTTRRRLKVAGRAADPTQPELPLSFKGGKDENSRVVHLNPNMVRASA